MPNDKSLHRAAARIVKSLVEQKLLETKDPAAVVEKRVFDALRANFQEEAAIDREAERILEANKRQMVGMDQRTLFTKAKEKIARDRGFVL
jgi:hypothetical protein